MHGLVCGSNTVNSISDILCGSVSQAQEQGQLAEAKAEHQAARKLWQEEVAEAKKTLAADVAQVGCLSSLYSTSWLLRSTSDLTLALWSITQ